MQQFLFSLALACSVKKKQKRGTSRERAISYYVFIYERGNSQIQTNATEREMREKSGGFKQENFSLFLFFSRVE